MSCCLLRALKNKLLTRDRLCNFGITQQQQCILCHTGLESVLHLFFECSYGAYLWSLCKLKLELNTTLGSISEEAKSLSSSFNKRKRSSFIAKVAFSAVIWHIWKERKNRIFQFQERNKVMVFRNLYEDIHVLVQNCQWKSSGDQHERDTHANWGL